MKMKELKVVRLKDVKVIAKGCAESCDVSEDIADGRAVVCLHEPEELEINGKTIESIEEILDVISECTVEVYEGACMLINTFHELVYVFSDGEYGHIVSIPKEWLRMVGFWNLAEMGD